VGNNIDPRVGKNQVQNNEKIEEACTAA